jgi:hypothetical protein
MGDAKKKDEELQRAKEILANGTARPSARAQAAALLVDLCAHSLVGAAMQIGKNLQLPEVADEVQKAADHLRKVVVKLLGEPPKVIVAPAGAIPGLKT